MDLGTIQTKLESGEYPDPDAFAFDVRLVWSNAKHYNQPGSGIYIAADKLAKQFDKRFSKLNRAPKMEPRLDDSCMGRDVTDDDKIKFTSLVDKLTSDQLGQVVDFLEKHSPDSISEDEEDLEIEITKIQAHVFLALVNFADHCVNQPKKRKT
eukprot:TRINITY_DN1744_c0_g1_i1.p1 TRINITY_DN1744_c0_g1~~TRINITY_DN1744_c0_g1_i1.p1  ORF type:complete len:153 (+),score=19.64 TRINITY_DN1744_c0_g1_i1:58-516(+)